MTSIIFFLALVLATSTSIDTRIGSGIASSPTASLFGNDGESHGQTVPAVCEPFGMTFWVPQTRATEKKGTAPYYYEDTRFQGFRASHWLIGSAVQDYGTVTVMGGNGPLATKAEERASTFSHATEVATPGYYSAWLDDYGMLAEATGTCRSGIYRFSDCEWICVEVNSGRNEGTVAIDTAACEIRGSNPVRRFYIKGGKEAGFSGWFTIRYDRKGAEVWTDGKRYAWVRFPSKGTVTVKVGTSFTDAAGASLNLDTEIPGWDFDEVRARLEGIWDSTAGRISIESPSPQVDTIFYTSLYHCYSHPRTSSDVDGRYPSFGVDKTVENIGAGRIYYDDYSMWDTFRAEHPLLTILEPQRSSDMMNSLVLKAQQGGWLPIFPLWQSYTSAMIGDHVCSVLADAWVKGIRGFDRRAAYKAMRRNAFEQAPEDEYKDGRGRRALESYIRCGYVPLEDEVADAFHRREQVSRTLEYAYDDWCVSVAARKLGKWHDAKILKERSESWRNVLDPRTGYVRGRHEDGTFEDGGSVTQRQPFITEGSPCHYTWFVPHDVEGLKEAMGGEDAFLARLDSMFTERRYWHGNEPCHQVAYMYNWTSQPWKSGEMVRSILASEYHTGAGGLCGNDDAGQMSAWYVFSSLGFYPVCPGSGEYALGCPAFQKASVDLGNGRILRISVDGDLSKGSRVREIRFNGKVLARPFISHKDLTRGGSLEFCL